MARFSKGDLVIVNGHNTGEHVFAHYLDGSYGYVREVHEDGLSYSIDFEFIVDSNPEDRKKNSYELDYLVKNAWIAEYDLEPFEPEPEVDSGFDLVFGGG